MADQKTEQPAEAPPAGSKKKLVIIIVAVVALLLIGGAAAFFLLSSSKADVTEELPSSPATEAETTDVAASESPNPQKEGPVASPQPADASPAASPAAEVKVESQFGQSFTMKPFNLNLGNPLENHYIRLEVSVEYLGGDAQKEEIERRQPQLRDAVVSVVSRKTREFLLGPDGKDQLRREILIRINRVMTKPIQAVYITDILIE